MNAFLQLCCRYLPLPAVLVAIVLSGQAQAYERDFVLTQANFGGRTMYVAGPTGNASVRFVATGEAAGTAGGHEDKGKWWIEAEKLCLQWQSWLDAKPHCFGIGPASGPVLRWKADTGEEGIAYFTDAFPAATTEGE